MSSGVMSQVGTHLVSGDDSGADLLDKSRHGDCCGQNKRQAGAVAPPSTGKAQAQQQREEKKQVSVFVS